MDIIGTASSAVTICGAGLYVGRAVLRAAGTVKENTAATRQLADQFRTHRADVDKMLAEHGERIARLEGTSRFPG